MSVELIRLRFKVPSQYGTGESLASADFTPRTANRSDLCQGRVSNSYGYRTHPCDKRANRELTGYAGSSYGPLAEDAPLVTVHVCGNHDVVAKATRAAKKAQAEYAARDAKVNAREAQKARLEQQAEGINALVPGSVAVEYRPGFQQGEYSWVLQVTNAPALIDALQATAGRPAQEVTQ
jgi:hypothetical protein